MDSKGGKELRLVHDGKLLIATGHSRMAKTWKNSTSSWASFLARLATTTRTRETVAEYKALTVQQQGDIKDVGGYVGGYVENGRRRAGSVTKRSLVTLDADYAGADFLNLVDIVYGGQAYAIYSTHKHTALAPRLRLVIPLTRAVAPDEYQALSRQLASDLGMDLFDDTTYEPERLMYWPSTSADGEYVFYFSDGPWIDPDAVLARYENWRDSTSWPESSRAVKQRAHTAKKQGEPTEKPGIIGAFCRVYDIDAVIAEYLPGVYTPCAAEGRYTYAEGSTSGGLVVYDGKYAYSHHGTDPISGLLCNSFDLVRLHKYADLDEDPGTPINRQPSYMAMYELALKDPAVVQELDRARRAEAGQDFGPAEGTEDDAADSWALKLDRNAKTGVPLTTAGNVLLILRNDPGLKDTVAYNEFNNTLDLLKDLPWRPRTTGPTWTDRDDAALRNFLSNVYQIKGRDIIMDALTEVMLDHRYHPVRDYLNGLTWDGVPRLERIWIDYLGAEDSPYIRAVTRKHMVAAIARVMQPGIKFDNVIVLCGPQGIGKSTMLRKIGRQWFTDSLVSVQGKEALEQLQGSWIIEMGEMYATRKAESEAVKQFLSKQADRFRVAYGRRVENFPRQCVFYGSTNDEEFLRDRTGNRRFWPVEVPGRGVKSFTVLKDDEVSQIWAEALELYKAGESLYLDGALTKLAIERQEGHREASSWEGLINSYLDQPLPPNWDELDIGQRRLYLTGDDLMEQGTVRRLRVCALEVWTEVLGGSTKNLTNLQSREINSILRRAPGWKKAVNPLRFGKLYGQQKGFIRVQP